MLKNKKFWTTTIVLAIAIICVLLATILFKPKANELMRFAICPMDMFVSTYYFVLYDDATLKCFLGEQDIYDIQSDKFLYKIRKYAKKQLVQDEFSSLISLADEISTSIPEEPSLMGSGWYYVTLLYNGTVYYDIYQYSKVLQLFQEKAHLPYQSETLKSYQSEALERLAEGFITLSPIEIDIEDFDNLLENIIE